MARTYKRDSNGRFAGGGGGSGGRRGAKLPAPAARKVGSAPQRRRGLVTQRAAVKAAKGKLAAKDPADRSIKGTLSRRSQKGAVTKANKALAAAQQGGRVRLSGRSGVIRPGKVSAKPAKKRVNVSFAAMERRLASLSGLQARRQRTEITRDEMAWRAGQYPKNKKKRQDFSTRASQAERNRAQNTAIVAARAADFYKGAIHAAGNFGQRSRYSTGKQSRGAPARLTFSSQSAWRGYSFRPRRREA
jgi:hypothetical protein